MSSATDDYNESQPSTSFSSIESSQPCRLFEFGEILLATNYFHESLVIGKGGFGKVYKGNIINGSTVSVAAIKRLDPMSSQGASEFWAEVKMLSNFRHSHVVSLFGYCNHENEMILVYEYMPNGTLEDHLHKLGTPLSWVQRLKICIGAARGLDYLHTGTGTTVGVIHRDVKSSNILLDESWATKISDFGLSKTGPTNQSSTNVNTRVKGTFGYLDPDYSFTGMLTRKSDVYAFGVVLLEVLCRKPAVDWSLGEEPRNLARWVQQSIKEGSLKHIIDSGINGEISPKCLKEFVRIALRCLLSNPKQRPIMAEVVVSLNSVLSLQEKTNTSLQAGGKTIFGKMLDMFPSPSNRENSAHGDSKLSSKGNNRNTILKLFEFAGIQRAIRNFNQDLPLAEARLGQLKKFSLRELQVATDNFSNKNILGRGGFGKVYKGRLADGSLVAVKRMKEERTPGLELQFQTEVEMTSMTLHHNLLRLWGFCMTPTERLLVYPYMANGSVASCLRERPPNEPPLDWPTRKRIALGTARGLSYLHDHCDPALIHRDVNAASILLDEGFEAVLGNFGSAKFMDYRDTHVTTAVRGTIGHIAPEYLATGKTSDKTDVFGYGMTLLELITGERVFELARLANDGDVMLLDWVKGLLKERKVEMLVDPDLEANYVDSEVEQLIQLALLCTQDPPLDRPKMSDVLRILKGDGLAERWDEWQKAEVLRQEVDLVTLSNPDWNTDSSEDEMISN